MVTLADKRGPAPPKADGPRAAASPPGATADPMSSRPLTPPTDEVLDMLAELEALTGDAR